ncbi:MAG: serine hydrolase domain-containing protein [Tsuneonella suprasediminis]|nr:beta-lactamase family protein [Altererythrobacter sp. N1]
MSVFVRKHPIHACAILAGLTLSLSPVSNSFAATSPVTETDQAIRAIISDKQHEIAPGCIVGTFKDGSTQKMIPQGYADIESRQPIDGDTQFYAASISKQFTALAAATLIAQGKLALDDDVRRYLPELPTYRAPVTVGMLMHHTSGIRDSLGLLRLAGMNDVGRASKEQALHLLFQQQDTDFVPGTAYRYSNGGYLLLAEIVERVSGQPFADYAKLAIFKPIGMKSAYFIDNNLRPDTFAHGYLPSGEGFAVRDTFPRFSGSGGLMLSMNDLVRYEYDIDRGHKVWTPPIAKIMLTPGRYTDGSLIDDGNGLSYGGGLHLGKKGGQYVVTHTGSAEALKHAYTRLPDQHLAFAILCNRGDWTASAKLRDVITASGVRYPGFPATMPTGAFYSEQLESYYRLVPEGDGLRVEISSDLTARPTVRHFTPQDDGRYHDGSMSITPTDDPARILVGRGGIEGIILIRRDKDVTE